MRARRDQAPGGTQERLPEDAVAHRRPQSPRDLRFAEELSEGLMGFSLRLPLIILRPVMCGPADGEDRDKGRWINIPIAALTSGGEAAAASCLNFISLHFLFSFCDDDGYFFYQGFAFKECGRQKGKTMNGINATSAGFAKIIMVIIVSALLSVGIFIK